MEHLFVNLSFGASKTVTIDSSENFFIKLERFADHSLRTTELKISMYVAKVLILFT